MGTWTPQNLPDVGQFVVSGGKIYEVVDSRPDPKTDRAEPDFEVGFVLGKWVSETGAHLGERAVRIYPSEIICLATLPTSSEVIADRFETFVEQWGYGELNSGAIYTIGRIAGDFQLLAEDVLQAAKLLREYVELKARMEGLEK